MTDPLKKALAVVKQGTAKALSNKNDTKQSNVSVVNDNTKKARSSRKRSKGKRYNPYDARYKTLVKHGFKYSANQLAKYVYRNANSTKYRDANRRIKKLMYRKHNRLVLSRLSTDDRWDLPYITYPGGVHYCYVNALQYVYLIARSHRGCAVNLRNAMAEIAQSIVTGGVSANAVIRYARQHRGGING